MTSGFVKTSSRIVGLIIVMMWAFTINIAAANTAVASDSADASVTSAASADVDSAASVADEEPETVRIGYYENEVFQEGAHDGVVKDGYAYEYYRKISEYTGWNYEYVYGDFSDLYQQLLDGKIDLLAGLAWKSDRADIIGYPDEPMGNESYNLVKHVTDTQTTADPITLSNKTIGVLDSAVATVLDEYLDNHHVKADVKRFKDYGAMFDAFDSGDVALMAAEGDGAYGRNDAEVICSFGASDYYLCVSVTRPDLLSELNSAQAQLAAEETDFIATLKSKYYAKSLSSRAFTPPEKAWISAHDVMHVGYLNNYLPYSDTDEQGKATGIVTGIVPAILETLGLTNIQVTYEGYDSYDEMVADVAKYEIDVAFPVGGGLYYSEESGIYQSYPVVSSASDLVYKGEYNDAITEHFAVNENNRMQYYYVKTYFPDAQVTMYPSIDDCLNAIIKGEVSCTTLNGLRANDILKNTRYKGLSLRQLRNDDERCFGIRIGNEGLLRLLNRGINVIGSDYAVNLASRYTNQLHDYTPLDFVLDHILEFVAAIIAIAAVFILLLVRDSRRTKREVLAKESSRRELEEKNRELAESQEALSNALVAAEHANRAKTTFLNNMSHDIRTPMNAIVGFTALAASHIDNKEQVQDYLSKISVSSQHLLSLINDVLDMSRIESGKVKIEESDTHLPDLIHDLRTIINANVAAKNQELFIDTLDVMNEDIVTDKLRLSQVLLNILSNAIKYTPPGGSITFRVIEKPTSKPGYADFEFRIKDTGIGMSPEFKETISMRSRASSRARSAGSRARGSGWRFPRTSST